MAAVDVRRGTSKIVVESAPEMQATQSFTDCRGHEMERVADEGGGSG
jgi:hypothetical protein